MISSQAVSKPKSVLY